MTHHDLWADLPEWENDHDPGVVLDWWREAAAVLAPLSSLVERSPNEALGTAIFSAENRVAEQVERWEREVWRILRENMDAGRLTPFGEVLAPLLGRAGLTPKELLIKAGRIQEPAALETLLRHMHGPASERVGGYLVGWDEALSLTMEEGMALSWALAGHAPRSEDAAQTEEEDIHVTPTIIHHAYKRSVDEITHRAATVEHEKGRALIVFRSEEEAEKYRAATGKYPEEEGCRTAALDLEELGHVLEAHGCTHVAMPEPWTDEGSVDFFEASVFVGMLEESLPA